ncbi:hypothetical protein VNO77_31576 [Canavalia gladiata]|uniref:Uncharacterized protein n=1 Tax=Canavalia gladiata TaxID=3824 RepID=A0AAN9KP25_CANGL
MWFCCVYTYVGGVFRERFISPVILHFEKHSSYLKLLVAEDPLTSRRKVSDLWRLVSGYVSREDSEVPKTWDSCGTIELCPAYTFFIRSTLYVITRKRWSLLARA